MSRYPIRAIRYLSTLFVILLLSGLFLYSAETPETAQAKASGLPSPVRWGYYVRIQSSLDSIKQNIQNLDAVSPYYFVLGKNGQITGSDQAEVTGLAKSKGVKVIPMVQNSAALDDFHALISNPDQVKSIIDQIDYLVWANGYDGFHIDFENLNADDRPYLTQFMAALYARLNPKGKLVTMAVAAKYRDVTTGWAGPYDYAALAPSLDLVSIMAYDYSYSGGKDGPVAPINWVNSVSAYSASQFGAGKVLMGIPFYGYDWNLTKGGNASSRSYQSTMDVVQKNNGTFGFDETFQSPFADYTQDGDRHRIWFENARSMTAKMEVMRKNNLGGWAAWRLGHEGSDFWPVVASVANPTRPVPFVANSPAKIYFKETGHTLGSIFMKYWQKYGGLAQFGYPWTEEFEERNPSDGKVYIVQYFERARFEYHPEYAGTFSEVLLGLLGNQLTEQRRSETPFQRIAPVSGTKDLYYFQETGHTLGGTFKKYWDSNGGLPIYGFPTSEEFTEINPSDGKVYRVQYFERNRFEYHPENAGNKYEVLLGLLGNQVMKQKGWITQ
jgi:spore germination protein YaaH